MALIRDGVWSILNGSETAPEEVASRAKFRTRSDKALATIVLSVDPLLLYLLGDPEDPVAVWKKLQEQFQKKTWANKLTLRRKLHTLRLNEKESVQDHIRAMTETFNELAVLGVELTNEDRVVYLLTSLLESYNTLVTALEAHADVPDMEVVTERLLNKEQKQKDRETTGNSEEAFTIRRRGKVRSSIKCYRCHKLRHIQRNCPEAPERSQSSRMMTKPWKGHKKSNGKQAVNSVERAGQKRESDSSSENSSEFGLVTDHVLSANSELQSTWKN